MPPAYDILQHGAMIGDQRRLHAYLEAIRRAVRAGDIVVDLGSGTGIFAVAACRAGARRVYAIEPGGVIQVAREVVAANDCSSRVEFVEDLSTNVTLPAPADVVVLDVRGVLPDDQIPVALDARRRLLRPEGRIIPASDTVWAAPVSAPELFERRLNPSYHAEGVDVLSLRNLAARRWYNCRVSADAFVAEPACVTTIDYQTLDAAEILSSVEWTVSRSGTAHGFVAWFESLLYEELAMSNHPSAPPHLYGQGYFPWPEPVSLVEGQTVRLDWSGRPTPPGYAWSWTTTIFPPGGGERPPRRFEAGARARNLVAPEAVLVPTELARIDREILDLMADGGLSVGEIARTIQRRNPAQFIRHPDALTWVGRLSNLYG